MDYKRNLNLSKILDQASLFVFGPRATGKTTLLKKQFPHSHYIDLLDDDVFGKYLRRPKTLSEEVMNNKKPIVIDEIQKLPKLLDEVQRLIVTHKKQFILTGSSARKLKRGSANLLGGRARLAHLFPLVFSEIDDFNLLKHLNYGGLPLVVKSLSPEEELNSYVNTYLREEILAEALVRNLDVFARFLDVMSLNNSEELYFEGLASDVGVQSRTLQNYVQILQDTMIGFTVPGFRKTKKRKAITRSKFYLFDLGVTNFLNKSSPIQNKSEAYGKAFEHFIATELRAYLSYSRSRNELQYWRTNTQFEVDFVIGDKLAIEVKSTENVHEKHLKGLKALKEEESVKDFVIISLDETERKIDGIQLYHWKNFLNALWSGKFKF